VRHDKGGTLHAKSFDSLVCGCLACPGRPDPPAGSLCNPGDRISRINDPFHKGGTVSQFYISREF